MKKLLKIILLFSLFAISCNRTAKSSDESLSILVFITGVIAGSPTYELLAEGAQEFAQRHQNVKLKIYEAGMNQSQWEEQLAQMVSDGEYDIVLGSNPSLPEICMNVAELFPQQKFIITDAHYEGHPQIRTYLYNQYEQSLMLGFLAGLISTSNMQNTNNQKRIGFIAAQEYPLLTNHKIPGFIEGVKLADPEIILDFRVIGSWSDANKAAELALAMIDSGVDVFSVNAGGASQGLIKTASERGAYIVWFNSDAYNLAPGVIIGCGLLEQKRLINEILEDALAGNIKYGISEILGIKEGYISFSFDNPGYYDYVPVDIQEEFNTFFNEYR